LHRRFPIYDYQDPEEKEIAVIQAVHAITFPNEEKKSQSSDESIAAYVAAQSFFDGKNNQQLKVKFRNLRNFIYQLGFSTTMRPHIPPISR
jgi:hypothetical protein